MTIYILFLLAVGAVSFLTKDMKDREKRAKIILLFSAAAMILIQGLRKNTVGIDLKVYLPAYHVSLQYNVFSGEHYQNFESGYLLFTQVLKWLRVPEQLFLTIVSIIVILPISYIWIKNSKMPAMSVFLYVTAGFFTFTFSGLRQCIALAIAFYSFQFVRQRKLWKFLLCILAASLFHGSALVFLFAYPLYAVKIKLKYYAVIAPVFLGVFLFRGPVFQLLYRLIKGKEGVIVDTNAYVMLILMIVMLALSYLFIGRDRETPEVSAYRNYLLAAAFIQIFASQSNVAMRAGYYYYLFITLLIPEVISCQQSFRARFFVNIGIVALMTVYYIQGLSTGYLNVAPYAFFWQ